MNYLLQGETMNVQVINLMDGETDYMGQIIHETDTLFCVLIKDNYTSFSKSFYTFKKFQTLSEIRKEKLRVILEDLEDDEICLESAVTLVITLFGKED